MNNKNENLIISSEIKSFLFHPKFVPEYCDKELDEYIMFGYVSSDKTLFKNVRQCSPGHYMIFQNNNMVSANTMSAHNIVVHLALSILIFTKNDHMFSTTTTSAHNMFHQIVECLRCVHAEQGPSAFRAPERSCRRVCRWVGSRRNLLPT